MASPKALEPIVDTSNTIADPSGIETAANHEESESSSALPSESAPEASCNSGLPAALAERFSTDGDLKLWLEYTGFFDAEYRRRVLDGIRRLKGLEAERAKVLSSLQARQPSFIVDVSPLEAPKEMHLPHPHHKAVESSPVSAYRSDIPGWNHSCELDGLANLSLRDDILKVMRNRGPRKGKSSGHENIVKWPRKDQGLTRCKDTRYFLVKSSNTTNVYMSRRDGLWITQIRNGPVLTQAFRECKSVVLFFSINKSKAFQGYAKMSSLPSSNIPKPDWVINTDLRATDPFRVDWINEVETEFSQIGDLKNPLNEMNPVFVGRDGQEFGEECGRKMMGIMDRVKALGMLPTRTRLAWDGAGADGRKHAALASGDSVVRCGLQTSRWRGKNLSSSETSDGEYEVHKRRFANDVSLLDGF